MDKALWEDLKTIIRCHSKRTIASKTPAADMTVITSAALTLARSV
ncbi:hypothetical protein ACYULU_09170 [Breznakiellaceae bacterium SP9]